MELFGTRFDVPFVGRVGDPLSILLYHLAVVTLVIPNFPVTRVVAILVVILVGAVTRTRLHVHRYRQVLYNAFQCL